MSTSLPAAFTVTQKRQWLPNEFAPSHYHVLVGRGKTCYCHSGNQQLTKVVRSFLSEYSVYHSTKKSKSQLIKKIVAMVRDQDADFVKFDTDSNRWYKVDERTAREKVSQTFRDVLGDTYRSSVTAKTLKRRKQRFDKKKSKESSASPSTSMIEHGGRDQDRTEFRTRAPAAPIGFSTERKATRPTRPDPPAALSTTVLRGNSAVITSGDVTGTTTEKTIGEQSVAAQNLKRLADISTALPPANGFHDGSARQTMGAASKDSSYAGYLKQVISRREYTSRRMSLLDFPKTNTMVGSYPNYNRQFGRFNLPSFYR